MDSFFLDLYDVFLLADLLHDDLLLLADLLLHDDPLIHGELFHLDELLLLLLHDDVFLLFLNNFYNKFNLLPASEVDAFVALT